MDRKRPIQPFSLLIKPASADCNLRCRYCFYLCKSGLYPKEPVHRMTDRVLETVIRTYMALPMPQYVFGWQGGEPTLMGTDFFKRVTELQSRYGSSGSSVANGLQTNATLITPEMARHFTEYRFLIGVSLDGPPEVHDPYRVKAGGGGTHADVMRGIKILQEQRTDFNILTLVTKANVSQAALVYRYLCDQGFSYHQYIPCVEFDDAGIPLPFSLEGEDWGKFLCELFDAWYPKDTRRISIRLFDSILSCLVDGVRSICHMGTDCRSYFVVEHNGDLFPCDFFVEPDLCLGSIMEISWQDALNHPRYRQFGQNKSAYPPICTRCPYCFLCMGDCLKHRQSGSLPVTGDLSRLCAGWKLFYSHTLPRFNQLADQIRRDRVHSQQSKPGKHDPCPCGSGKKYAKCCMPKGDARQQHDNR